MADRQRWRPVLFNCPRTGSRVQPLLAEEMSGASLRHQGVGTQYESISCLACSGIHLVDPVDGKVLGAAPDDKR